MPRPKQLPISSPKSHQRRWHEGTVAEVRPGVWRAWRARTGGSRPSQTFKGANAAERAKLWAKGDVEPAVLLLGHWLDRWLGLRVPIVRPSTARNYRIYVGACAPIAGRPLAAVTTEDFQVLTNELLGRFAWNTVRNWRSIISTALRAAVPRYIDHNPMTGVRLPKPEERTPAAWRTDEVALLVEAARGRKHEAWLWMALGTGIRLGEARALLWTDIDVTARTATISKSIDAITNRQGPTKTGKTRMVEIPDEVIPVLVAHRARQPAGERRVFGSRPDGSAPLARALEEWFSTVKAKAGVSSYPLHSTRHTYATLSFDAGVPLKEVSEQLGHANVAITASIYSHAVEKRQRRAANAMGQVLSMAAIRRIGSENGTRSHG